MCERTLRIVAYDYTLTHIQDFIKSTCEEFLISEQEIGSRDKRPHYHVWFITKYKEQCFRSKFKKRFPKCIGNSGYSLSKIKKTTELAESYTIKEGCSLASSSFSTDQVEKLKASWVAKPKFKKSKCVNRLREYCELFTPDMGYIPFATLVVKAAIIDDRMPPTRSLMSRYYNYVRFKDLLEHTENIEYDVKDFYQPDNYQF